LKTEGSTCLEYTGLSEGLEHLKIETKLINERFASEMDGRRTRSVGSGTDHCWIAQTKILKMKKGGQFPDELVKIEVTM
jgi:hypothetical protein